MRTRSQKIEATNDEPIIKVKIPVLKVEQPVLKVEQPVLKVDNSVNNDEDSSLKKLHEEMFERGNLINNLKKEQYKDVMKFRQMCLKRHVSNYGKNRNICNCNLYMSKCVEVKPHGLEWERSLCGDYENVVYLCYVCKRAGIQLASYNEYGVNEIRYM